MTPAPAASPSTPPPIRTRSRLRAVVGLMAAVVVVITGAIGSATPSQADEPVAYTNPVSASFTRDFADPTVIRGRDGWYYAYATNGRRSPDDERQLMMISRSRDLVGWEYVGPVFTEDTMPRYDGQPEDVNRQFWAPEISFLDGRYVLYYSYVLNTPGEEPYSVIAAATSEDPAGPWVDTGQAVTGPQRWEPRPGVSEWRNVIDPEVVTTPSGQRYLYYGSVLGGVQVVALSPDGLRATGEPVQLTPEHRFEAAYVVHRDGYYYLFMSEIGGCCAGPASGYPVVVARSEDPQGPFLDRDGHPVAGRHAGGTPVLSPNGNAFVSTGHNAIATDVAGQDWMVTHALDRTDPYVDGRANARQLALTRLDWIDGWPVGDAGRGIPEGPVTAPATDALVATDFEDGSLDGWRATAGWAPAAEAAGGFVRTSGRRELRSTEAVTGDLRLRAAVRLAPGSQGQAGLELTGRGRYGTSARIDRERGQLVLESRVPGGGQQEASAPLPDSFDHQSWHELELTRRDGHVVARVSDSGQYDPVAVVELDTPAQPAGPVVLQASGTAADFDDLTVAPLYEPVTTRVPDPAVGVLDPGQSEEFDGPLDDRWQWVREPAAQVSDGALDFPVQTDTLIDQRPKEDDGASVLLRDMPEGSWTVETRVSVPFGETLPYGWPQAGLIAYTSDDDWVELAYTTRNSPRFVAFARETPAPGGTDPVYGHAALGPSADTMWLRLQHTVDADGEHLYRAATSFDGQHWVWHGTRVMPAGEQPRVGLVAMDLDRVEDGAEPLSARFDWFRVHR